MNPSSTPDAGPCPHPVSTLRAWPGLALRWLEGQSSSLPALRSVRAALLRDLLLPDAPSATAAHPVNPQPSGCWESGTISREQLARSVRGKVVLITGGSSGIGLETARRVAAAGATTLICGRGQARLDDAERQIASEGGAVSAAAVDLSDPTECAAFVQGVRQRHGGVDVLVNNAGRSIRRSVQHSLERLHDFQRTMQINYFGALQLTLGLLPAMVEKRAGHVINISSIAVLTSTPRFAAYNASKAALAAWTRCAASEYADLGIAFTTIYMPLVRTPMSAPTQSYEHVPALTPQRAAEIAVRAMVERPARMATSLGTLADIAHTIAPHTMRRVGSHLFRSAP